MEYTNSIMEIVKTYDGTQATRGDCRFIKGEYYIKDKQCFLINDMWYRVNSGKIIFDNETGLWVVMGTTHITEGIIGINNNEPIFGHFSLNLDKNTHVYLHGGYVEVIDEKILLERPDLYMEGVNGDYFSRKLTNVPKEFILKVKPRKDEFYSFPFNYGSESLIPTFKEKFDSNFIGDPLLSDAYKYLGNYTFGVEFETERGAIPEKHLTNNGLIACRDGSIAGFEYTTIPLQGESGIQVIKRSCSLLKKYCSCSPNESLHIHIGGYPKTVRAIAALYRVGIILQKEIYQMFPYYYADTSKFKRKGYCNPLYSAGVQATDHKAIMRDIYLYLSNGGKFYRFPIDNHPMDRSGQHKWDVSPRYIWMNLIPIIWGKRMTVEFRCHTPTVNANKVINWLFILVAIVKYASKHIKELTTVPQNELPILTLAGVIEAAYPRKISSILIRYIHDRMDHYNQKSDPIGEFEILSEETNDVIKTMPFL